MNTKLAAAAFLILSTALNKAADASILVFDFTGSVTSSNDAALPVGTPVDGQLYFNYGIAMAGFGTGVAGQPSSTSTGTWSAVNSGETIFNFSPYQVAQWMIFSQTVNASGFQYNTGEPVPGVINAEDYEALSSASGTYTSLSALDLMYVTPEAGGNNRIASGFSIVNPSGFPVPYDVNGAPIFSSYSSAGGSFTDIYGNSIDYSITSMTPVPLPPAVWLILSALGPLYVASLLSVARRPRRPLRNRPVWATDPAYDSADANPWR